MPVTLGFQNWGFRVAPTPRKFVDFCHFDLGFQISGERMYRSEMRIKRLMIHLEV